MYTENELIFAAQKGDIFAEEVLAKKYMNLVRIRTRQFFLVGGDSEDLMQEGMFGLIRAIRTFDLDNGTSFKTYAEQCIHNRLINVIESAASKKHSPLNSYVSFERVAEDLSKSIHSSTDESFLRSTEAEVLNREFYHDVMQQRIDCLSKFEKSVLDLYLTGMTYKEIADITGKSEKSIDNAIQRIRKKMAKE